MSSRRPRHAPPPRSSWDWTLVTRALNAPTALPYTNPPQSQPPASQQAVQNPQGTTNAELDAAETALRAELRDDAAIAEQAQIPRYGTPVPADRTSAWWLDLDLIARDRATGAEARSAANTLLPGPRGGSVLLERRYLNVYEILDPNGAGPGRPQVCLSIKWDASGLSRSLYIRDLFDNSEGKRDRCELSDPLDNPAWPRMLLDLADDVAFALDRQGLTVWDQAKALYPAPPRSEVQSNMRLWLSKVRRLTDGCGFYEAHGFAPNGLIEADNPVPRVNGYFAFIHELGTAPWASVRAVVQRHLFPKTHEARRVDDAVRGVDPADLWCHSTMCVTVQAAYRAQERAVCVSVHAHVNTTADSRVRAPRLVQDLEMEEVEWSPGREGGRRRRWLAAAGAAVAPERCRLGGSVGGKPRSTRAHQLSRLVGAVEGG